MTLTLRNLDTIVQDSAAIAQAECPSLTDLSSGSPFLALLQASAYNAIWLQWLVVEVARQTRLATSSGSDVDSFLADFGAVRLASVIATGNVTFSRYLNGEAAKIAPGALVKTQDGVAFTVAADTGHALWNVSEAAYIVPALTSSATVPVAAQRPGTGSNIQAGKITVIASPINGIDSVTNASGFINGVDAETDDAAIARFKNFINTRSQATTGAVEYAIQSAQPNITFEVATNEDAAGNASPGNFVIFIDDGSGAVSDVIVQSVRTAVAAVSPIGVTFGVLAATSVTADVSMSITPKPGYDVRNLIGPVAAVVRNHINGLAVGEQLDFYRLAHLAQDDVEGVDRVTDLFINGDKLSLGVSIRQKIIAGVVAVQ